ncbi:MAG: RluA family pseudouridine synthase [Clostridia bacterium]
MQKIEINTLETDKNSRIDVFLMDKLLGFSRSAIQKIIIDGNVSVNGKVLKKNYKITGGEVLEITLPELKEMDISAQDIPLDVVYEDDDIIVINKPKGMVVHPAPGHFDGTMVNALMHHCKGSLSGINGEIRPGIVHRIDKDTSGLLVVAKNDSAHINLSEQIKEHSAGRVYRAIVFGNIKTDEGKIDKPIGRHKTDRKRMAVTEMNSRDAVTHYTVLERFQGYTYMEFRLETGRTHQIRVHMQSVGHPILGDEIYANRESKFKTDGQCLHAVKLILNHPRTSEKMEFCAEIPNYFEEILQKLRKASM